MSSMKISHTVRERVSSLAQADGRTVSETIAHLLDGHDRRQRFAAVDAAYAEIDADYIAETRAWDDTLGDGLDGATVTSAPSIKPGDVVWTEFCPTADHQPHAPRPAVTISTTDYVRTVRGLAVIVPVTTTDRGWLHHVQLHGDDHELPQISFAMTEQPRTISTSRIASVAGSVDSHTLARIRRWISDFTVMES